MSASVWQPPYDQWTSAAMLEYFRGRKTVHYFPVLDEEETRRAKIDTILVNRFTFNGESHELPATFDWRANPSGDIEWQILLHKFYYAAGLGKAYQDTSDRRYADKWVELTGSWIDSVPLDFLPSDVAGRRIQNWIFAHYYFVTSNRAPVPEDFYGKFLTALAQQVNHLCAHLTPARNHRTLELAAVFLAAAVFPEMKDAPAWLELARRELAANIEADLLADGVHCELSTDYHHLVLKNYLWVRRLAALNRISLPEVIDERMQKALQFALYIHKPDGMIPSLSDGDSRCFLDLLQQGYELYGDPAMVYVASRGTQGKPPALRSKGFPEAGYYVLRSGWGDKNEPYQDERFLVFDCGPLGRGNHGHFDLLNIEMAAYGHTLIVDPGRYTYDESGETNWRVRFRATAYHNTVTVDQKNQTRYQFHKNKFKINGPEPEFALREWQSGAGYDYLCGVARSHEYDAVHERRIFFLAPEYWIVSDLLSAAEEHDYDLRFHLSDQARGRVKLTRAPAAKSIHAPHLVLAQVDNPAVELTIEDGFISRSYGVKHAAPVLRYSRRAANAAFHTVLYPFKVSRPEIRVEELPVWQGGQRAAATDAFALQATIVQDGETFHDYYFSAAAISAGLYSFGPFTFAGSLLFVRETAAGQSIVARNGAGAELIDRRERFSMVGA